jgi:tetrahydromethanopterin S-methyltransferase subunit C
MLTSQQHQFIARTQIATGLAIGVLGIALATFAPRFTQWLLPSLGVLWAVGALIVGRRLSIEGARSGSVRIAALVIGVAAAVRLFYLLRHAA